MAPCETRLWQVRDSAGAYTVRRKIGWERSRTHRVRIPIFLHLAQQLIICVHPWFSHCKVVSPSRLFIGISHILLTAKSARLGTRAIRCSLRVDSEDEDQCQRNSLLASHCCFDFGASHEQATRIKGPPRDQVRGNLWGGGREGERR